MAVFSNGNFGFNQLFHFSLKIFPFRSFDTETQLWDTPAPVPFGANCFSAVEMNGLIYVSGEILDTLHFWCYNPEQNSWTQKAAIHIEDEIDSDHAELFKVKGRICFCNVQIGFHTYDHNLDGWSKVENCSSHHFFLSIFLTGIYNTISGGNSGS